MNCSRKMTPAEMVAALHMTFIVNQQPPAIDKDGNALYQLLDSDIIGAGCAVYTIGRFSADFQKMLSDIGTHKACSVSGLQNRVKLLDLFDVSGGWTPEWTESAAASFLQSLQDAHDEAGAFYHQTRKFMAGLTEEQRLSGFRELLSVKLGEIATSHKMEKLVQKAIKESEAVKLFVKPSAPIVETPSLVAV